MVNLTDEQKKRVRDISDGTFSRYAPLSRDGCERAILQALEEIVPQMVEQEREKIESLRKLALRGHYSCEDSWYSCPMSSEGCANEHDTGCTCGAEKHNAEVNRVAGIEQEAIRARSKTT